MKSLFEQLGGTYHEGNGYLIPDLSLPIEEEQPIGTAALGLSETVRKVTYTNLFTNGKPNTYLADIDKRAQERFERLIEGLRQAQGINGTTKGRKCFRMDRATQ